MKVEQNRTLIVALIVVLLLVTESLAKQEASHGEVLKLFKDVSDRVDIRAAGNPPFSLRMRVEVAPLEPGEKSLHGTLALTWFSPGEWREEITLLDFKQVRIAFQGKLWTSRPVPFEPVRAFQLEQLLDLRSQWTLRPFESAEEKRQKKQQGIVMRCVEVDGKLEPSRELCTDAASLLPLAVKAPAPHMPSYEYGDYAPFGNKQYPRLMRVYEGRKLVLEAHVVELASSSEAAPSLLSPPTGAISWDWCDNATPPKLLASFPPHYPEVAKRSGREGVVSVFAVIAKDGTPSDLAVVRSAGPDFDTSALAAVARWHYRPQMCGTNSVPIETVFDVRYTLRP